MGFLFGQKLARAIEVAGLTKYKLAKLSGVSDAHLTNLTSGKRDPTDDIMQKLAPHLGVPLKDLRLWADLEHLGYEGLVRVEEYIINVRRPDIERFLEHNRRLKRVAPNLKVLGSMKSASEIARKAALANPKLSELIGRLDAMPDEQRERYLSLALEQLRMLQEGR